MHDRLVIFAKHINAELHDVACLQFKRSRFFALLREAFPVHVRAIPAARVFDVNPSVLAPKLRVTPAQNPRAEAAVVRGGRSLGVRLPREDERRAAGGEAELLWREGAVERVEEDRGVLER